MEDDAHEIISRRRIYFHRLVGDDVLHARGSTWKREEKPIWAFVFLVYVGIAAHVLTSSNCVDVQYAIKHAVKIGLTDKPFAAGGSSVPSSYFDDIHTIAHVGDWLTYSVLPQLFVPSDRSDDLSLLSFNRIVGLYESHSSTIRLTQRRIREVASDSTRFQGYGPKRQPQCEVPGVPKVLSAFSADAWAASDDTDRGTITGSYIDDSNATVFAEWKEVPRAFNALPGFLAVVEIKKTAAAAQLVNDFVPGTIDWAAIARDIVPELPVSLVSVTTNAAKGAIPPVPPATSQFALKHLFDPNVGMLDHRTASLAIDFLVYNANYQCISLVEVAFGWNAAGSVNQREIKVETIPLNVLDKSEEFIFASLFYVVLCLTAWFGCIQVRQLYRLQHRYFYEGSQCVDLLSIIFMLWSCIAWMQIERVATEASSYDRLPTIEHVRTLISDFRKYRYVSAMALFIVFVRIINFMEASISRVKLLIRTVKLSLPSMSWYLLFILTIFVGFVNVAQINFGALSADFQGISSSFVSCFIMFLGDVSPMDKVTDSPLTEAFFIPFMLFFFFVSVQMFNAIINYAYNKASEEMEPIFEKERQAVIRRDKARRLTTKHKSSRCDMCWQRCITLICLRRKKNVQGETSEAAGERLDLNNIEDQVVKDKVQEFLNKDKGAEPGDTLSSFLVFIIFGASYLAFLYMNLNVMENFQLKFSLQDAMARAAFPIQQADSGLLYFTYNKIQSLEDLNLWLATAPHLAIFEGLQDPVEYNALHGTGPDHIIPRGADPNDPKTQYCINGWNCLLKGPTTMVRHTQRKTRMELNPNKQGISTTSHRRVAADLDASDEKSEWEKDDSALPTKYATYTTVNPSRQFCRYTATGGYNRRGGIECLMSYNPDLYREQTQIMQDRSFVARNTTSYVLELVAYNGNMNMVVYCSWVFNIHRNGQVDKQARHTAFMFRSYDSSAEIVTLIPGMLYAFIVLYYIYSESRDVRMEAKQKWAAERKHLITVLIEHFCHDFFNFLDLISILLSAASIALFVNYVLVLIQFKDKYAALSEINPTTQMDGYSDFLNYVSDIAQDYLLYVRISAFNILVIFFRMLKLLRDSPRMNKLNQTLWVAKTDIGWFVVMLFTVMFAFVLFAHITFGPHLGGMSTLPDAFISCFTIAIGSFNYKEILQADPVFGPIFFFTYVLSFSVVFLNIFFAIIDRFFVTATPPPMNIKKQLKPYLQHILTFIQWDDDISMEEDPNAPPKEMPPSRRKTTADTKRKIDLLLAAAKITTFGGASNATTFSLTKACGDQMDEQLLDVEVWAKGEARRFMDKIARFQDLKVEGGLPEKQFLRTVLDDHLRVDVENATVQCAEALRTLQYNVKVHETHYREDQKILANYILLLQHKVRSAMHVRHVLELEVQHLMEEAAHMRFGTGSESPMNIALHAQGSRVFLDEEPLEPTGLQSRVDAPNSPKEPRAAVLVKKRSSIQMDPDNVIHEDVPRSRSSRRELSRKLANFLGSRG